MRASLRPVLVLLLCSVALPCVAQSPFPVPWPNPATPAACWQTLRAGNATYVAGALPYTDLAARRDETAGGQHPPVTILSCSDSRVPPELVFGRTVGDLFVVRVAGEVADAFAIASIEYAIEHDWTKLIVVMGHEKCGAVVAALSPDDPPTPSLVTLVQRIRESFVGLPSWSESDRVEKGVKANAHSSAAYLLAHSAVIRKAVLDHHVGLIVAYDQLKSGKVEELP
jgi:carbonic anhydrase